MKSNSKQPVRKMSQPRLDEGDNFLKERMGQESGPFKFSDDSGPMSPNTDSLIEPKYSEQMLEFIRSHQIQLNQFGFVYLQLNKDVFFPNEMVVGNIIINIKKPLPRSRVYLQFKGYQAGGQHNFGSNFFSKFYKLQIQDPKPQSSSPNFMSIPEQIEKQRRFSSVSNITLPRFSTHKHYPAKDNSLTVPSGIPLNTSLQMTPAQKIAKKFKQEENLPIESVSEGSSSSFKKIEETKEQPLQRGEQRKKKFQKSQTVKSLSSKGLDFRKFKKSETTLQMHSEIPSFSEPKSETQLMNQRTLGNMKHHKINSIFRAEKRIKKHSNKLILFDFKLPVFEFRQRKVQNGILCIPISFRLPMFMPGSFQFQNGNKVYRTAYKLKVVIEEFEANYSQKITKFTKDDDKSGGQFSEFKTDFLMRDKKEIFVREFIFTDSEVTAMRQDIDRQTKLDFDASPLLKQNVVKKTIEKRYRNMMTANVATSQNEPNSSGLLRVIQNPQLTASNFSQGGDLVSHEYTGLQNAQGIQHFNFKLVKCCCITSKQKFNLKVVLNQSIFYTTQEVKAKVEIDSNDERVLKQIEYIEVMLLQRVSIFQDPKKLSKKTFESCISRFMFRKSNLEHLDSKVLNCSFCLEKLLANERRIGFIFDHLNVPNKAAIKYSRLQTILELSSSNLKMKTASKLDSRDFGDNIISIQEQRDRKDFQESEEQPPAQLQIPRPKEVMASKRMKSHFGFPSNEAGTVPSTTIRKIESMNLTSDGHIVRNQFFLRVQLKASGYSVENNGQLCVPLKIRSRRNPVLSSRVPQPSIPEAFGDVEDIQTMSGAVMKLEEKYISIDSLMVTASQMKAS